MAVLDVVILIPELFFTNFILLGLWVSLYFRYKWQNNNDYLYRSLNNYGVFLLSLIVVFLLNSPASQATILGGAFNIDLFSFILKSLTLLLAILVILTTDSSDKNLSINKVEVEVNFIRLLMVLTMLLIISINDFIYLFFTLEVYTLASYVLIGYRSTTVFSAESSLKYFIISTVFSILMAYAIAVFYWVSGLTNFSSLELYLWLADVTASNFQSFDFMTVAILLFVISIFFKLAAAPFHFWAPDVYDGAPTSTTYFLFIIPKVALLSILIKLTFLYSINITFIIFVISGVLNFLVGSLGGLLQTKIKRLLTYSMINNNGLLLFALSFCNLYSVVFIVFFLIIYTFTLIGLFTSILNTRLRSTMRSIKNIWSWTNLFFISKTQTIVVSLLLFSSAGIPPLVGFIAKFLLLFVLVLNFTNLYYLTLIALFIAPLSCFYYIRIVKVMAFLKKPNWLFLSPLTGFSAYILSISFFSLIILFLVSGLVINIIILSIL